MGCYSGALGSKRRADLKILNKIIIKKIAITRMEL